jgi:hypothetical protein
LADTAKLIAARTSPLPVSPKKDLRLVEGGLKPGPPAGGQSEGFLAAGQAGAGVEEGGLGGDGLVLATKKRISSAILPKVARSCWARFRRCRSVAARSASAHLPSSSCSSRAWSVENCAAGAYHDRL